MSDFVTGDRSIFLNTTMWFEIECIFCGGRFNPLTENQWFCGRCAKDLSGDSGEAETQKDISR